MAGACRRNLPLLTTGIQPLQLCVCACMCMCVHACMSVCVHACVQTILVQKVLSVNASQYKLFCIDFSATYGFVHYLLTKASVGCQNV